MVSGRFSAPNVSPGEGKRLDMNSLDGETAAEVWVGGVASSGERREAPPLVDGQKPSYLRMMMKVRHLDHPYGIRIVREWDIRIRIVRDRRVRFA